MAKSNEAMRANFQFFTILAITMVGAISVRAESYSAGGECLCPVEGLPGAFAVRDGVDESVVGHRAVEVLLRILGFPAVLVGGRIFRVVGQRLMESTIAPLRSPLWPLSSPRFS